MNSKKLLLVLAALLMGAVVTTGSVFSPAIVVANEHDKDHKDGDHKDGEHDEEHKGH
jgi:hypothetical protein